MCVCVCTHMSQCTCRGQLTTPWCLFPPLKGSNSGFGESISSFTPRHPDVLPCVLSPLRSCIRPPSIFPSPHSVSLSFFLQSLTPSFFLPKENQLALGARTYNLRPGRPPALSPLSFTFSPLASPLHLCMHVSMCLHLCMSVTCVQVCVCKHLCIPVVVRNQCQVSSRIAKAESLGEPQVHQSG